MIKVKRPEYEAFYFFVEWHTMCDLAGLRTCLGIEGVGSLSRPCPLCELPSSIVEQRISGHHTEPVQRRPMDKAIFQIPMWRQHACGMHLHHRVVERLLQMLLIVSVVLFYSKPKLSLTYCS